MKDRYEAEAPNQDNIASHSRSVLMASAFIIATLAGTGGYYLAFQSASGVPAPQKATIQSLPTPYSSPTPGARQDSSPQASFYQNKLDIGQSCPRRAIGIENLPVSVNQDFINVQEIDCTDDGNNLSFKLTLQNRLYRTLENLDYDHEQIYLAENLDKFWFTIYGLEVGKYNALEAFIAHEPHAGPTTLGGKYSSVYLIGVKRLILKNGSTIYAVYPKIAIEGNDSRLVSFLKPYSTPSALEPGKSELTTFPLEKIRNQFFSDLSNLKQPEGSVLSEVDLYLSAIKAR